MSKANPVLGRLAHPTAETKTRLAVLSDLHLSVEKGGSWRVSHQTENRLNDAVKSLNNQENIDAVVFIGDLVQDGTIMEYELFDEIISELNHPFFAIPGNHDLISDESNDSLSLEEFEQRYTPNGLPYHQRIGGIDLLALNSNRSTKKSLAKSYVGQLDSETLSWLEDKLTVLDHPVVAVHHNLSGTRSLLMESGTDLPVSVSSPDFENSDALSDVLASGDAPLVLTGHLHFPAFIREQGVMEFTLPSLGPYPNVYSILEVNKEGTTVTMHSVAEYHDRIESFVHGRNMCRVQLAAAQLAGLPLVDDFSSTERSSPE